MPLIFEWITFDYYSGNNGGNDLFILKPSPGAQRNTFRCERKLNPHGVHPQSKPSISPPVIAKDFLDAKPFVKTLQKKFVRRLTLI